MTPKICLLCGSNKTIKLFEFKNRRTLGAKKLSYKACNNCGIVYLYPMPKKNELSKIYKEEEYFRKLAEDKPSKLITRLLQLRVFREYDEFAEAQTKRMGMLLDVGCGNGEFLQKMQDRGWKVWGFDASKVAVENAEAKIGNNKVYHATDIVRAKIGRKFDLITMWHVLEHIYEPKSFIKKINSLLKPRGLLVFEVPNADSLVMRIFKENYNWLMVPEHIYYYSPESVSKLLEEYGFKVRKITFPHRANLNFSLSLRKFVVKRFGTGLGKFTFLVSLPLTFIVSIIASRTGKSEVFRVVAEKND